MIYLASILLIIGFVVSLVGGIMILIDAFKKETVQGILCLFVPFYSLYYLFAKYTKENKKTVIILVFAGIALIIIGYIIFFATFGAALGAGLKELRNLKIK